MAFLNPSPKQKIGCQAEQLACDYLAQRGLICIEKNYRAKTGEIDLIMRDKTVLVFIEVRYRKNNYYGSALDSIDHYKQQRIINTAHYYLLKCWQEQSPCRFDVVSISGNMYFPQIEWIPHAFDE